MEVAAKQSTWLEPLPVDFSPELKDHFEAVAKNLGFVPNSILIMQRNPKMVKAFAQMAAAVWDPDSKVDRGLQATDRPCRQPRCRMPILHGTHY